MRRQIQNSLRFEDRDGCLFIRDWLHHIDVVSIVGSRLPDPIQGEHCIQYLHRKIHGVSADLDLIEQRLFIGCDIDLMLGVDG